MNTQLLPQTIQVIEPTIIRYSTGNWYEIHRSRLITDMFGIEPNASFAEMSDKTLREIIDNFHFEAVDVTAEVYEELHSITL